jgi:methanethiol S-methyltransferase
MRRLFWIVFGALAHGYFAVMVPFVFLLLYRGGGDLLGIEPASWQHPSAPSSLAWAVGIDLALLLQFAVPHSILLLPRTRKFLDRIMPGEMYGALFTVVTATCLLATSIFWQPLPGVVYSTSGVPAWLLLGGYLGSWVLLFYSLSLTGAGWQTGWTPYWAYVRKQAAPRRSFVNTNLYAWMRHPTYLAFLGLIWFTPRMTTDHLLLTLVWSVYVYIGSVLKDRRLLHYMGGRYRTYMEQVPGYPLVFWGPLARLTPAPVVVQSGGKALADEPLQLGRDPVPTQVERLESHEVLRVEKGLDALAAQGAAPQAEAL